MKGRLVGDVDLLVDLNSGRQDNIFHLRIVLSKCFESHRGQREVLSEVAADNRAIVSDFTKLEAQRCSLQAKIIERYGNTEIDANNKNILFSLLSRTQKSIKSFYNKLLVVFPKLADFINPDTCEFQNEIRQLVLEKMSGKVKTFFEEFQKFIAARFKRELLRFTGFYTHYGCLIDKRAEKSEHQLLKIEKFGDLVYKQSVCLSVKYHQTTMNKNRSKQTINYNDLYGISDLEQSNTASASASCYTSVTKQEGFCELFTLKMDRTLKQLMARNQIADKTIGKFLLQIKIRETQATRVAKSKEKEKKSISNQRRIRSSSKNVKTRSLSETNESIGGSQAFIQPPLVQQKPVVRQTLVEMNINDKNPLPQLTNFRLTEFPATSFSFYKDKLNKTQLLMLFRKRLPVILKQNA